MDRSYKYAFCKKCDYFLWQPATCECGSTRCHGCTEHRECCESKAQGPLAVNKTIQNIAKQYIDHLITSDRNLRPKHSLQKLKLKKTVIKQPRRIRKDGQRKPCCSTDDKNTVDKKQFPPWLHTSDIECSICIETFVEPITTPCGHMFCKLCLERLQYYSMTCPICVSPLRNFDASKAKETTYMASLLIDLGKYRPPKANEMFIPLIPIQCCILPNAINYLILETNRFLFQILSSPKRLLGIVPQLDGEAALNYGTIVEIWNVVFLDNGLYLLTVISTNRFKILNRHKVSRITIGHIQKYYDIVIPYIPDLDENTALPVEQVANKKIYSILRLIKYVLLWAKRWYQTLETNMQSRVSSILDIPNLHLNQLIKSVTSVNQHIKHGPGWLWNLITVLPISDYNKTVQLKNRDLEQRLINTYNTLILCCNAKYTV